MSKVIDMPSTSRGKTSRGTDLTRFNALQHGVLSRHVLLPWEDGTEFGDLLTALVEEYAPKGPIEEHLVEELAGTMWRKRRLRMAERSAFSEGLRNTFACYRHTAETALAMDPSGEDATAEMTRIAVQHSDETASLIVDLMDKHEGAALRAINALKEKGEEEALAELPEELLDLWRHAVDYDLGVWLCDCLLPQIRAQTAAATNANAIRDYAFGAAFQPEILEKLARYETSLDRKLEKCLTMLLRLQEIRVARQGGAGVH